MEHYFDDEDELPSIVQISRKDFSEDEFVVDEFLTKFHKYQTLEDLENQLKSWDKELGHELIDVINKDYGDFVGLGNSLSGGENKIQDVKMNLLRFQTETKKVKTELENVVEKTNKLIQDKKDLVWLQDFSREMILYLKKLEDIEKSVHDKTESDLEQISEFAKQYIHLKLLARDLGVKAVQRDALTESRANKLKHSGTHNDDNVNHSIPPILEQKRPRLARVKSTIIELVDTSIKKKSGTGEEQLRLAILKAKLLETYD
ncbi:hypothetical protein AWJ20_2277 [Sugiyamaella lignohabitans]|uniref:Conserved oligomeric Golgi complex subunit 2 n=1 Tax=Sugiyamaella lignohabitans TaxID=796027 RepID=A0A167F0F6_9ASCO|nr:uncharacterized protein AWJ20_2277 [Sugiyamaella lignohabitans]ANB14672.1 hypothetical protein AWJ20_2277 [Sugiyamaella lignohabitans]